MTTSFEGIEFEAIAVSPSATETPLQIVCFFDQTKNQTYAGGTQLVDEHFGGRIRKLRQGGLFKGSRLETLLLTPQKKEIPAERLLLIGLGDPDTFTAEDFEAIGHVAVFEAVKLGVQSFCFAPSIKDAGLANVVVADVSTAILRGMSKAITAAKALEVEKLISPLQLNSIFLLAGAANLEHSQQGLKRFLS